MLERPPTPLPLSETPSSNPEKYHFEAISEAEPAIITLVEKIKDKIDRGAYDFLLSDDTGGRIPTLTLGKIMKKVNPGHEIKEHFITSGKSYQPDPAKRAEFKLLVDHLRHTVGDKKVLLVTQYAFLGKTLTKLTKAMEDAGIKDIDIAIVNAAFEADVRHNLENNSNIRNIYIGSTAGLKKLDNEHDAFSGIKKSKGYKPTPITALDGIKEGSRDFTQEKWEAFFDIKSGDTLPELKRKTENPQKIAEFEQTKFAPITDTEKEEINHNILLARLDVERLADNVVKKIWGDEKETSATD